MEWVVYVLRCADGSLYVGMTKDLPRRLGEHHAGKVAWTKPRRPVALAWSEPFTTRQAARDREKYFKSGWGKQWLKGKFADPSPDGNSVISARQGVVKPPGASA